jgi:hypothetical protein
VDTLVSTRQENSSVPAQAFFHVNDIAFEVPLRAGFQMSTDHFWWKETGSSA